MPLGHGPNSSQHHTGREKAQRSHAFKGKLPVKMLVGIADHREIHLEALDEFPGLYHRSHAHQHDPTAGIFDALPFAAQLRHLLAAERSAVVPEKNQHQRALPPEVAQRCPRMIPQLNLLCANCRHIQIHGRFLSSLVGRRLPKPHERTEIVHRHDTDELPLPGHRQQVASTFIQSGNNLVQHFR